MECNRQLAPGRRDFLKHVGVLGAAGVGAAGVCRPAQGAAAEPTGEALTHKWEKGLAVLVDTTKCVGCRLCEYACKKANHFEAGPIESYDDQSVFKDVRRPGPRSLTVLNEYRPEANGGKPVWVKINCLHCNHCSCGSACIVGALKKGPGGAVTYDAWKCIGCRYCMVACPFQLPAYEYDNALTPQIFKCQFCWQERTSKGELPGCVAACPREALTFGKRGELIELAYERIAKEPGQYVNHVYGEHEVGGTAWMYLSAVPFEQIGLPKLGNDAPPATTEKIQRGLFRFGAAPLGMLGFLGAVMFATRPRRKVAVGARLVSPSDLGSDSACAEKGDTSVAPTLPSEHQEEHEEEPRPVERKLMSPGMWLLGIATVFGVLCYLYRMVVGIGPATNMDQQHPWGMWIAMDVASGVALAVGGFTSIVLVNVFRREKYRPIVRPALLTAMLGYTVVVIGLLADLGRWYNVWHPMLPNMWQPRSVLFQVGICEMICVNLLWIEFTPIFMERLVGYRDRFPRLIRFAEMGNAVLLKVMPVLLLVGCVANFLHQTALGNLLVITPYKLHPLWHTPALGLLFLVSAIAVGFPMAIWESLFASWSMKLKPEMHVLTSLAKYVTPMMGVYLLLKLGDLWWRGAYQYLDDGSLVAKLWWIEVIAGVVTPMVLMAIPAVRRSAKWMFLAATLLVGGLIFNRFNVFVLAYRPPVEIKGYFPSVVEIGVTVGLMSALMFFYRVVVTYFPVISQEKKANDSASGTAQTEHVVAETVTPTVVTATPVVAGGVA